MTTIENVSAFQRLRTALLGSESFFRSKPGDFKKGLLLILGLHCVLFVGLCYQKYFESISHHYYMNADIIGLFSVMTVLQVVYVIPAFIIALLLRRGRWALGILSMAGLNLFLVPVSIAICLMWMSCFHQY